MSCGLGRFEPAVEVMRLWSRHELVLFMRGGGDGPVSHAPSDASNERRDRFTSRSRRGPRLMRSLLPEMDVRSYFVDCYAS